MVTWLLAGSGVKRKEYETDSYLRYAGHAGHAGRVGLVRRFEVGVGHLTWVEAGDPAERRVTCGRNTRKP